MSDKPNPTITLLFLHVVQSSKGDKSYKYVHLGDDDNDGRALEDSPRYMFEREKSYTHKKPSRPLANAQPGTIVTVEYDSDKEPGESIWPSTAKLVGTWKNEDEVVKWRAIHRAQLGEIESDQAAAKANKRDLPAENLEPFQAAYRSLRNKRQRSQLLAWVIEEITR